ncbi:putative signal peptide protein [Puccinia sorghi]|uniref:Putative signal peptide protein n=1 Tax=Puccinia sorghi TaxID=27349 RepID=A0A0L6VDD6_9BASI|nr:putative signal peptide protein [Puccinia sorghi]
MVAKEGSLLKFLLSSSSLNLFILFSINNKSSNYLTNEPLSSSHLQFILALQRKLAQLPAVDMQHAPAKLLSKLHLFAYEFLNVNYRQLSKLFLQCSLKELFHGLFVYNFICDVFFLLIFKPQCGLQAAIKTGPVCTCRLFGRFTVQSTGHRSLVESIFEKSWSNTKSFVGLFCMSTAGKIIINLGFENTKRLNEYDSQKKKKKKLKTQLKSRELNYYFFQRHTCCLEDIVPDTCPVKFDDICGTWESPAVTKGLFPIDCRMVSGQMVMLADEGNIQVSRKTVHLHVTIFWFQWRTLECQDVPSKRDYFRGVIGVCDSSADLGSDEKGIPLLSIYLKKKKKKKKKKGVRERTERCLRKKREKEMNRNKTSIKKRESNNEKTQKQQAK